MFGLPRDLIASGGRTQRALFAQLAGDAGYRDAANPTPLAAAGLAALRG